MVGDGVSDLPSVSAQAQSSDVDILGGSCDVSASELQKPCCRAIAVAKPDGAPRFSSSQGRCHGCGLLDGLLEGECCLSRRYRYPTRLGPGLQGYCVYGKIGMIDKVTGSD